MPGPYNPGSKLRLSCRFKAAGASTDPTTVSVKVRDPAAAVVEYTYPGAVVRDSIGNFHTDIVPGMSGRWYYKFIGTGACEATAEASFEVRDQVIA